MCVISWFQKTNKFLQSLKSSLLMVYEGQEYITRQRSAYGFCNESQSHGHGQHRAHQIDDENSGGACYDADISNSSTDYNIGTSHEDDVSQDLHATSFGECSIRRDTTSVFFPISEETVFLDSDLSVPSISTSSPVSEDSWMLLSNSSSDEYSCQINATSSTDDISSDFDKTNLKSKRNHIQLRIDEAGEEIDEEDEDDEMLIAPTTHISISKRARVKDISVSQNLTVPEQKRRMRPRPIGCLQVDVRMIDFAHTTFASKTNPSQTTVHHGPDCGFLTGLDSLSRLLVEILSED